MKTFLKRVLADQLTSHEKGLLAAFTSGFIMATTLFGYLLESYFLVQLGTGTMLLTTIILLAKFMYDAFQD